MDPNLLGLPIAIGAAVCTALAGGHPPKQAISIGIYAVPDRVWRAIPNKQAADMLGRLAFQSSYQQCPSLWELHVRSAHPSTTL